jgi:transcriptional regulator with XRE-family HTH domain
VHVTVNGEKVQELRKELSLSKKDLAREAGVTEPTIVRAEDSRPMFPQTVRRIADVLGVDARDLARRLRT